PELLTCQSQIEDLSVMEGGLYQGYGYGSAPAYLQVADFDPGSGGYGISFFNDDTLFNETPGFVDSSTRTIVVNASNPSSQLLTPSGTVDASSYPTATVGSSHLFTYQYQTFFSSFSMPDTQCQYISIWEPEGETIVQAPADIAVAGLPLSELEAHGAKALFGNAAGNAYGPSEGSVIVISLDASALSFIASNGYRPATASNPEGKSPLDGEFTLSVTFKAYLSPNQSSAAASYGVLCGYNPFPNSDISGTVIGNVSLPEVYTNGPADDSLPSSLGINSPSSQTGLWFKSLNADGTPASGSKFMVQNSSGEYLEKDVSSSGTFTGWSWTSAPGTSTEFAQRNTDAIFSFGGLANGTYTLTEAAWPESLSSSSSPAPSAFPYPGKGESFKVTLSYSSPETMTTQTDPAGLVAASQDEVYSLSPVKMASLVSSSLSTDAYQTETVGIPFAEGWEGYLPIASVKQGESASQLEVSVEEKSNGLEISGTFPSGVTVADIPLPTLLENGASSSYSRGSYTITLPYQALKYL
ncbi:MAG: hypothetical protein IIY80_00210, partial [Aeriscardovia sp.]|nr:hypothetical protein [Aeriscardovia sp.]